MTLAELGQLIGCELEIYEYRPPGFLCRFKNTGIKARIYDSSIHKPGTIVVRADYAGIGKTRQEAKKKYAKLLAGRKLVVLKPKEAEFRIPKTIRA